MSDDFEVPELPSELTPVLAMLDYVPKMDPPGMAAEMRRMLIAYAILDVCKMAIELNIAEETDLDALVPDDVLQEALAIAIKEYFLAETEYEGSLAWECGTSIGFIRGLLDMPIETPPGAGQYYINSTDIGKPGANPCYYENFCGTDEELETRLAELTAKHNNTMLFEAWIADKDGY